MKTLKLIYLASPYSHPSEEVRHQRWQRITEIGANLISEGHHIFGPITESHAYSTANSAIEKGWQFWKEHDEFMLSKCDELWVVMMNGWKESEGVQAEIQWALKNQMPIKYLEDYQ